VKGEDIARKMSYGAKLDEEAQIDAEEMIAAYLFDEHREGFDEKSAGAAGRDILHMVLQQFRPDFFTRPSKR
jgi:hypothetical protein